MTIAPADEAAVARMWRSFTASSILEYGDRQYGEREYGEREYGDGSPPELAGTFAFGDSAAMADQLAALVRYGPKRATAGLLIDTEDDDMPVVGAHWIILDGAGRPVCVIRTTDVRVAPLGSVDAAFAWDEGEGDRSLAYWKAAHERYFRRRCEQLGVPFSDELDVVFERFAVIWPPPARPATPDDAAVVAAIWSTGWRDGHLGHVPDELVALRTDDSFALRAAQRVDDTVVTEVGGAVAGFVMIVDDEVEQVYVAADHRGSGLAAALLADAVEEVRRKGHDRAWLAVAEGNARARRFYEREGWSDEGPLAYAAAGDVVVPCHRYTRRTGRSTVE